MITAFELGMQKVAIMAPRRDPAEMPESIQRMFEMFGVRAPKVPIMHAGGQQAMLGGRGPKPKPGTNIFGGPTQALPEGFDSVAAGGPQLYNAKRKPGTNLLGGSAQPTPAGYNPTLAGIGYAPTQTELAGWK